MKLTKGGDFGADEKVEKPNVESKYQVLIVFDDDGYTLQIFYDGNLLNEYCDFGEPEDNSFIRDYKWVQPELKRANEMGFSDGVRIANKVKPDMPRYIDPVKLADAIRIESESYDSKSYPPAFLDGIFAMAMKMNGMINNRELDAG